MLVKNTRRANERNKNPIYALIDSQSVKTTSTSKKEAMMEEKRNGKKRHIVTDIIDNLLCINIHTVNVNDTKHLTSTFQTIPKYFRIERTFSWLSHSRHLSKDYKIRTICTKAMIIISHLYMLLRRF